MMFKVHQLVRDPYNDMTVFDKMASVYKDKNYPGKHTIGSLGSGSDYRAFYQLVGVPSIDISYRSQVLVRRSILQLYEIIDALMI